MQISRETICTYIYTMPTSGLRKLLISSMRRKHPKRYKNGRNPAKEKARISDMVY